MEKDLFKAMRSDNFDVVINLECKFNLDFAMIINKINSKYKIGFKNEYSES